MPTIEHIYITNIREDTDRSILQAEFGKFGDITKIYISRNLEFAKVYYKDPLSCHVALHNLKRNLFGWKLVHNKDTFSSNSSRTSSEMYDTDYVSVFGVPIEVVEDETTNQFYANCRDLERSGFKLFTRQEFQLLHDDDKRHYVLKDFYHCMTTSCSDYIKKNQVNLTEEDIVDTINRVKSYFGLKENHRESRSTVRRSVNHSNDNNFSVSFDANRNHDASRSHSRPRQNDRSCNRSDKPNFPGKTDRDLFFEPPPQMRPPKNSNKNFFAPTESSRSTGPPQQNNKFSNTRTDNRNQRDNRDNFNKPRQYHQQNNQRSNNDEELWDKEPSEQKPRQQNSRSYNNEKFEQKQWPQSSRDAEHNNKSSDAMSQSSDPPKKPFVKFLESIDNIGKVDLDIGNTYKVRVTFVDKVKDNVCWVQEVESSEGLDDVLIALNDAVGELETVKNVKRGQLAIAEYEGLWCRCRVVEVSPLKVSFIDYGNTELVDSVKELPDEFRKIPQLAIRLVINRNNNSALVNEEEFTIRPKTKYLDDTYLSEEVETRNLEKNKSPAKPRESISKSTFQDEEKTTAKPKEQPKPEPKPEPKPQVELKEETKPPSVKPKEKHYFDMPEPLIKLKNGDKVMLVGLDGNRFSVKTRECAQKSKEILEYIKGLNKCDLMLSSAKEGQLVLASMNGQPNLCRSVIKRKESPNIVTVEYLDFPGEEQISLKALRNIDDNLAEEKIALIFTPAMKAVDTSNSDVLEYISNIVQEKKKFIVVITEDGDFDMQMEDGSFLSQELLIIAKSQKEEQSASLVTSTPKSPKDEPKAGPAVKSPKLEPEPVKKVDVPLEKTKAIDSQNEDISSGTVSYEDMPFIKAAIGSDTYICYNIIDISEITLIATTDESLQHFETISDLEIEDDVPFEPEIMDMCVVHYKEPDEETASWNRAVCLDKEANGFSLSFVDFGYHVVVPSKIIRKYPLHLKKIPILGILCSLKDVPHGAKQLARVKELLPQGQEIEVKVNEFLEEEIKYVIEIPDVYEKLKKENLL